MKFSFQWISEMVDGLDVSAGELGRLITLKTAETEAVLPVGGHMAQVCAARVLAVEPISGSHNVKATVDTGRYGTKTVVCGAPNCRTGIVTAYVPAGCTIQGRTIGAAVIGGVESDGMLACGAELEISKETGGILELALAPGDAIPGCRPDHILEIDNKSLTHRPDLWGHHGMAREASAIVRKPLRDPVHLDLLPAGSPAIKAVIENLELCPRYSALVFENVTVAPSPLWLQQRLLSIGLNPINNIVDVTNYVMSEIAQPMHAFDAATLDGDTIFVRLARPGESITALDQNEYELDPHTLLICDASGPVAIAGVIGGLATGVTASTTRIVLESANFHAASIRKTSGRLKLRTDASMRFEKSQDPENTLRGLARAIALLGEVSPGIRLAGGVADTRRPAAVRAPIELKLDWVASKLGRDVDSAGLAAIFAWLGFGVEQPAPELFRVTVPSWRATKDISIKDDLVEEAGRILGYDSITPAPPLVPSTPPPANAERAFHQHLRAVCTALGFSETYNYSFVNEQQLAELGMDPAAHVKVLNPISSDQGLLRTSLLPGMLRNLRDNSRHLDAARLFEIGVEIHRRAGDLPLEKPHLMAGVWMRTGDGAAGLFELKRLAEWIGEDTQVRQCEPRMFEHPARTYELVRGGQAVGRIAELHPRLIAGRAAVLDFDLTALEAPPAGGVRYQPLLRYPTSSFDLSVVGGARETVASVRERLSTLAGQYLHTIEFVRLYEGPPLAEGRKSLSFRLTVCSHQRTLSADEISNVRQQVIEGMEKAGYELRV